MTTTMQSKHDSANEVMRSQSAVVGKRLVIVGGGMATHGLCQRLVHLNAHKDYQITIFGNERYRSYDRVALSKFFDGKSADDLLLEEDDWYEHSNIQFLTNRHIVRIDRDARMIFDADGVATPYDTLVLATGSRAWMPPIPGSESDGVFLYRTLDDLERIQQHVERTGARIGAVIGGGLLGLESAKVLLDLGLKTSVIEMAPALMPRQLDNVAAARLRAHVESIGVDVHVARRTESIQSEEDGRLTIRFGNAEDTTVDVLIVAAGVRANDELARDAGLSTGSRGGIAVDYRLQTDDPNIYAIGECASFQDHVYGLVAPCYRMADELAKRLAGQDAFFFGADESAELKLLGIPVVVLGKAIGQSPSCVVVAQEDETAYRKIIMEQGRFAGAACVGEWEQLPMIRDAIHRNRGLWPTQRAIFQKTGSPWPATGALSVVEWPDTSIICSCRGITKKTLVGAVAAGSKDADALAAATGASTACGSCRSLVCELAGGPSETTKIPGAKTLLMASLAAAVFSAILILAPPIRFADSVQDSWRRVDVLWRSDFARQVTGYTTLGIMLLSLVFSLRKRFNWFQFGSYGFWRSVHGILGAGVLIAVAVHTGFRLGENLNFVLAMTFLAVAVIGSAAGIASSLEGRVSGARAIMVRHWRPRLTRLHMWLFWPLPALIAIHIFTFYWFSE